MGTSAAPRTARRRPGIAAIELFVAAGALYGGANLLADAEGFGMRTEWLAGSPFGDYTVSAAVLIAGIGGGMAAAAALALLGSPLATVAARVMGAGLLGFLAVETVVLGYRGPMQIALLVAMGVPALMLLGSRPRHRRGRGAQGRGTSVRSSLGHPRCR